jgi:hypothetical protein
MNKPVAGFSKLSKEKNKLDLRNTFPPPSGHITEKLLEYR